MTGSLVARAEAVKAKISEVTATATSRDGAVTVTVDASGVLQRIVFGPAADHIPRTTPADTILATTRQAQAEGAAQLPAVDAG